MYFTFPCPQCDKALKVRNELAGHRCRCPYCKTTIAIPERAAEPETPEQNNDLFPGIREFPEDTAGPSRSTRPVVKPRSSEAKASSGGGSCTVHTDVSLLTSGLLGVLGFVGFYAAIYPFSSYFVCELFIDRGWVPFAEVFLTTWAFAILALKSRKLRQQKASMLFDLLPNDWSAEINQDTVDRFVAHINELPVEAGQSFLVNRVRRGLEHFRVRKSAAEVATVISSQSDIDANGVESSYTLLKVFIWAIPILGFIGTVIGISAAVGGFSGALDQAADIEVLKGALGNVTGGLATAFDTTLLALLMSMLVMFPASSMQKSEEDLLNWVDEYCNENLLKRLNDGREGAIDRSTGFNPIVLQNTVDKAMAPHHAELQTWIAKLEAIGTTLTDQIAGGWGSVHEQLEQQQQRRLQQIQSIDETVSRLQTSLLEMNEQTEAAQQHAATSLSEATESLQRYFAGIEQGLTGLNDVLGQLGQQQVVIEMHRAPSRWSFFSRRNGG